MKYFNDLLKNKSFISIKTLFLYLSVFLLVFSVSCSNTSKSLEPFYSRQLTESISNQQPVEQPSNQQPVEPISNRQNDVDITEALQRAVNNAFRNVSPRSIIAIVHIATPNRVLYDFLAGEVEHILVDKGYRVVDRRELDQIRAERDFQLSWEVDDRTAVSIGRFVGADAIIIGRLDGEGQLLRARLRVLDTETALVIGTASEPFTTSLDFTETLEDLTNFQTINITSSPSGARVLIYDRNNSVVFHGTTPTEANLNTFLNTNYLVVLSSEGYQNHEQNIRNVQRRLEPDRIHATLTRVPVQPEVQTTQNINITSNPLDASVLIYNQAGSVVYTGRTPINTSLNTIVNTSYLIVISRDGYVNSEQTIRVLNGRLERDRVEVSLNRVPSQPTTTAQNTGTGQTQINHISWKVLNIVNDTRGGRTNLYRPALEVYIKQSGTMDWGPPLISLNDDSYAILWVRNNITFIDIRARFNDGTGKLFYINKYNLELIDRLVISFTEAEWNTNRPRN